MRPPVEPAQNVAQELMIRDVVETGIGVIRRRHIAEGQKMPVTTWNMKAVSTALPKTYHQLTLRG
jgi:hypothetical protein